MDQLKALAICGSLRKGSYNLKLLKIAVQAAKEAGLSVETADLGALRVPDYNHDVEEAGLPKPVSELTEMIKNCDLLLIASPEYNYSIPGVLKNAIDWVSRVKPNPFSGKVAALFGASNGQFGTVRGQLQLRQVFLTLNITALPQPQVLVANADSAFDNDGNLKDKAIAEKLKLLLLKTFDLAEKMKK